MGYFDNKNGFGDENCAYQSVDEAILALTKIEVADLTSEKTPLKEAIRLCREVLTVVLKCENLQFTDMQIEEFQDYLKMLGCATFLAAADKFKSGREQTIAQINGKKNNIEFPLCAFTNLIDCGKDTFRYGISKLTDGRRQKCSWADVWLSAQEKAISNNGKNGK